MIPNTMEVTKSREELNRKSIAFAKKSTAFDMKLNGNYRTSIEINRKSLGNQ